MKILFSILASLMLLAAPVRAADEAVLRYERTFADAARAYDTNRLADAIAGWKALADEGQVLPEVLFNLGNAYYRNGNLGEAILAYRRAQRLAPRDPGIRANLGFAAQSAGIVLPEFRPPAAFFMEFSRQEWLGFGAACFWLLFLAAAAWIAWPRTRFISRPALAALALLLLAALAGLVQYHRLQETPECVVLPAEQKILSSPLDSATPLLAVPAGAIVRKLDERGNWFEIRYDTTRGWLPAGVLARVP